MEPTLYNILYLMQEIPYYEYEKLAKTKWGRSNFKHLKDDLLNLLRDGEIKDEENDG